MQGLRSRQHLGTLPPHLEAAEGQAAEALGLARFAHRPRSHTHLLLQGCCDNSRTASQTQCSPRQALTHVCGENSLPLTLHLFLQFLDLSLLLLVGFSQRRVLLLKLRVNWDSVPATSTQTLRGLKITMGVINEDNSINTEPFHTLMLTSNACLLEKKTQLFPLCCNISFTSDNFSITHSLIFAAFSSTVLAS